MVSTTAAKYEDLTGRIIGAFYHVYNVLGWGFLEKVYHNAMMLELSKRGMRAIPKAKIDVLYDGTLVGEYFADILVEDQVIVEIKSVERFCPDHEAQLINYLKATDKEVGLLLNFGPKPELKRKVFDHPKLSV